MPRPIWKGHLTFGLVMIPVTLYSAESPRGELSFTLLDSRDHARVRYKRVNEVTGEEVPWKSIVKGYEVGEGNFVVVTPADFKKAAVRASKLVEITDFVSRDQIPPQYFERPYFLAPTAGGEKVYALLRETLRRAKRVGIASVVIHTRQYLSAVLPEGPALVLNTMRYHDELRSAADLEIPGASSTRARVAPREIDLAEKLIENMSSAWEPSKYHDEYREQLRRWIQQKARTGAAVAPEAPEEEPAPPTYNIMDLLKRSVEEQRRPAEGRRRASHRARTRRKAG